MTNIEMLHTRPVSVNGLNVEIWVKGSRHSVADDLLKCLILMGVVALYEDNAIHSAPENKAHPMKRKQRNMKHG